MFEIIDKEESSTIIKVIGVGGAGGNAVEHMIREGVQGVEFIAANTDAQALQRNTAHVKVSLGKSGLGAGARPEAGKTAAEAHKDEIRNSLQGAQMVFITAGMGGGTGTGAAPVVAEVAREMGVLTVGVVTKPFSFEGGKRMKSAEAGIVEFGKHVDSLIVILNDKLMDVMGEDADVDDCFKAADDVLKNAVGGIAEIITYPGLVNVDFEDVRTVMGEMGRAMMGSAVSSGVDRARIAAEQAVASPLLEGVNLSGARGVLVNITASKGNLKMKEVNEVMNTVKAFAAEDAHIIFGAVYDDLMGDALRVTVVATGLGLAASRRQTFEVVNTPVVQAQSTGTYDSVSIDYNQMAEVPAVVRKRNATVEALANSGVDRYDIPAFLRKQAD
ncbi:MAG: Cell division protein FtsZ [Betaproteobacteria bacterium ADurb.Bin341]|nr:MAG: Cell division protein FtsZ [Betaproteobacteria bacterium ADurb.Bin341]